MQRQIYHIRVTGEGENIRVEYTPEIDPDGYERLIKAAERTHRENNAGLVNRVTKITIQ